MVDPAVRGLRIVLLGMPAAGKSSLLGALAQAAETQPNLLGSKLDAPSDQILDELQKDTYDSKAHPTLEEVSPYPLSFQTGESPPLQATIIDTAGHAGQDLLTGKESPGASASLERVVKSADTLLLVVDSSATPAELDTDFQELSQFLRTFELTRARESDIAGLPVYLVLSKCDMLARKDDTSSMWIQRIEEAKRKVDERFHDFMAAQTKRERLPFGKIDLHLWATAVKRPPLADRPARPTEPYGVAELFRQCLQSAQAFHGARQRSQRRMLAAVSGVLGMLGLLGVVAGAFFMSRPSAELATLENAAYVALPAPHASSAERLREPLDDKIKELKRIEASPEFAQLPVKTQEEVKTARMELEAYRALDREFVKRVRDPRFAGSDDDLDKIQKGLDEFAQPANYAAEWSATKLGRRQEQYRQDVKALRRTVHDEEEWVRAQIAAADALTKEGGLAIAKSVGPAEREMWFAKVQDYVERDFRHKRSDRIPDAVAVSYDTVYRFSRVDRARRDWDKAKSKLRDLRKLAQ